MKSGYFTRQIRWGILSSLLFATTPLEAEDAPPDTRLFSHIRTYAELFTNPTEEQKQFCSSHFDISNGEAKASATSLNYTNFSDFDLRSDQFFALLTKARNLKMDAEDAFVHYDRDVQLPANVPAEMARGSMRRTAAKEDRFASVLIPSNLEWVTGRNGGAALDFHSSFSFLRTTRPQPATNELSIEAWIKPAAVSAGPDGLKPTSTIAKWCAHNLLWIDAWGRVVMEINTEDTRRDGPRFPIPAYGEWYHVVGVASASSGFTSLYVNGTEVTPALHFLPATITACGSSITPTIGGDWGMFQGALSDVRIYNRVLTPQEVRDRHARDVPILDGLVAAWKLDEGEGTTVTDWTGNGADAEMVYKDLTGQAFGDAWSSSYPITFDLPLCRDSHQPFLYIGNSGRFRELSFNLSEPARAAFAYALEYWNGAAWRPLSVTDLTDKFRGSGRMTFSPPPDWQQSEQHFKYLYWVRLHCRTFDGPLLHTVEDLNAQYEWKGTSAISGEKYAVGDQSALIVPGWNPKNDPNGDGYVDDSEASHLADPGATARFRWRSRAPSRYLTNRWVANFNSPLVQEFAKEWAEGRMRAQHTDGVFVDNSNAYLQDPFGGAKSYAEYPESPSSALAAAERATLAGIKSRIAPRKLFINTDIWAKDTVLSVDGTLSESSITYWRSHASDTPFMLRALNELLRFYQGKGKSVVLHGDPNPDVTSKPSLQGERDQSYALARYYLLANAATYFSYEDSSKYATPWEGWFEAIAFDVGIPTGDFFILNQRRTSSSASNLVTNSSFEDAAGTGSTLPAGWACSVWEGSVNCRKDAVSHSGSRSIRIDASSPAFGGAFQFVALKPNTTYTLSSWIKTSSLATTATDIRAFGAQIFLYPGRSGAAGGELAAGINRGSNDWTLVSTTLTTGSDVSGAYVYAGQIAGGTGTIWVDDVFLEEGSRPVETVYARQYTKALVLLKGRPSHDAADDETTETILALDKGYRRLRADGSLSSAMRQIALRSFEGAILIPSGAAPDAPQGLVIIP